MRKRSAAVTLALCALLGVSACAGKEEGVFTGETVKAPKWQANLEALSLPVYADITDLDLAPGTYISVIGKMADSPYWTQVQKGVKQAADDINERLGYTGEDKIKVVFNAPSGGEDIDEQVNILDEEMARYPDVIAIASIDENASGVQFDLAVENGIDIVAFDSGNSYQGIQCTCMTDNAGAAQLGASKLSTAIDGSGEVAVIVQDSVSANARERTEAFINTIQAESPGVSVVETIYMDRLDERKRLAAAEQLGVSEQELAAWSEQAGPREDLAAGEEDPQQTITEKLEQIQSAADAMSDDEVLSYYLKKHPDLKGCFGMNAESVLAGAKALESMGESGNIVLMGFDTGKEQTAALESGTIDGLIVQNPFGMGYATVVAAARTVLEIGNEAVVNTGYIWVDRDNMQDRAVQSMLYE